MAMAAAPVSKATTGGLTMKPTNRMAVFALLLLSLFSDSLAFGPA
jgi:hypothetical protein